MSDDNTRFTEAQRGLIETVTKDVPSIPFGQRPVDAREIAALRASVAALTAERDAIESTCRARIIGHVIVATVPQMVEMLSEQAGEMQRQRDQQADAAIEARSALAAERQETARLTERVKDCQREVGEALDRNNAVHAELEAAESRASRLEAALAEAQRERDEAVETAGIMATASAQRFIAESEVKRQLANLTRQYDDLKQFGACEAEYERRRAEAAEREQLAGVQRELNAHTGRYCERHSGQPIESTCPDCDHEAALAESQRERDGVKRALGTRAIFEGCATDEDRIDAMGREISRLEREADRLFESYKRTLYALSLIHI